MKYNLKKLMQQYTKFYKNYCNPRRLGLMIEPEAESVTVKQYTTRNINAQILLERKHSHWVQRVKMEKCSSP